MKGANPLLTFSLPLFAVFSLTAMAPMNLAFGVVVLAFFVGIAQRSPKSLSKSLSLVTGEYLYYACALVLACLISLVAAAYWPYSYAGHNPTTDLHAITKLLHFIFPLIYLAVFRYEKNLNTILQAWWATTAALVIIGVIQFFTGIIHSQRIPTSPQFFHVTLFFGHHLSTASIMIFPTFAALAVALGIWVRKRQFARWEWAVGLGGLLILFLSFARTAWLVIPLGIILLLVRYLKKREVTAGLIALVVALGLFSLSPVVQERLQNNMGVQERFNLWKANLDFVSHRPLTGIGFLKTQEMSEFYFKEKDPLLYHVYFWGHAHNNFFEMLGGTGILGFLTFIAWVIFSVGFAYSTSRVARAAGDHRLADLAAGLGIALILMHVNGLTNVNFWEGKVLHQQMWALGLLLMIRYKSET